MFKNKKTWFLFFILLISAFFFKYTNKVNFASNTRVTQNPTSEINKQLLEPPSLAFEVWRPWRRTNRPHLLQGPSGQSK